MSEIKIKMHRIASREFAPAFNKLCRCQGIPTLPYARALTKLEQVRNEYNTALRSIHEKYGTKTDAGITVPVEKVEALNAEVEALNNSDVTFDLPQARLKDGASTENGEKFTPMDVFILGDFVVWIGDGETKA